MKLRIILLNVAMLLGISALVALATYSVNLWFLSSYKELSPTDAMFFEGMFSILIGFLLLIGRGGINISSQKAAVLAALAGAVFKQGSMGPSEIMRRDRWKPEGFTRAALILILAGVFMILVYFLTL